MRLIIYLKICIIYQTTFDESTDCEIKLKALKI